MCFKNIKYLFSIGFSFFFFLFLKFDLYSSLGVGIFIFWIVSLVVASNDSFPIMQLLLSLFSLQYLFGPALTYNGFDVYTIDSYQMKIENVDYFSFVIPIFLAFTLGFRVFFTPQKNIISTEGINQWFDKNPKLPYVFILLGIITPFFSSIVPSSLKFLSYLIESFKFIGLFIIILSNRKSKLIFLIITYVTIFLSAFLGGMFHDLLIWLIVLGLIISYKYKPSFIYKFISIILFVIFIIFIQAIKGGLRDVIWDDGGQLSLELIEDVNKENLNENAGFFTLQNIGPQINRINQGWILASTIENVPQNISHTYGSLTVKYLYAALLPRIFDNDKLKAGDQVLFNTYSGHVVFGSTSMALGLFSDAYIEFGRFWSILYVFFFGFLYGFILNKFLFYSKKIPILILFSTLVFVYPMRPDCETPTVLGHLFKSLMLLIAIFHFWRNNFILNMK